MICIQDFSQHEVVAFHVANVVFAGDEFDLGEFGAHDRRRVVAACAIDHDDARLKTCQVRDERVQALAQQIAHIP